MSRCVTSQRTNPNLYSSSYLSYCQTIDTDTPDLTQIFPGGVSCIQVLGGNWQGFTKVSYQGAQADLTEGQLYNSLAEMSIGQTVKSIRKL